MPYPLVSTGSTIVYLVSGIGIEKPNPVVAGLEFGAVHLVTERSGIGCGLDGAAGLGSSEAGITASWVFDARRGSFDALGAQWLVGRKHSEVWAFEPDDVYQGILLRLVRMESWGCTVTAGAKYLGHPGDQTTEYVFGLLVGAGGPGIALP